VRFRFNAMITAAAGLGLLLYLAPSPTQAGQAGQAGAAPQAGAQRGGRGGGGGGRGQRGDATPAAPSPRLPNGKPDLSGHWANPYTPNMGGRGGAGVFDPTAREKNFQGNWDAFNKALAANDPMARVALNFPLNGEAMPNTPKDGSGNAKTYDLPFTEWGLQAWKDYDAVANGDYAGSCLPFGMSRNINSPHGVQLIQNNDTLAFLFEQNTWFHLVPTNSDFIKWPKDLPQAWNGVSTGRWEGDTLVVETSNFHGWTRLDTAGHPHSSQLKMTNTFLRLDSRTIQHTVTVHDPKAYTTDWMNVRTWPLKQPGDVLMEYSCEENNRGAQEGTIHVWKFPEVEP